MAVCHGAAGVLAIADAFARHAGRSEAAALGDRGWLRLLGLR
jgi:hypothetical protein